MHNTEKIFFIGLIVLIVFVPLGLLANGTAFGECGSDELMDKIGYVPEGVAQGEEVWKAPIPDYMISGQEDNFPHSSIGYYASAIVGMVLVAGAILLLGNILVRKGNA
jgi:hypothetical protein